MTLNIQRKIEFSTKAETLASLRGSLKGGEVLPSFAFPVEEWIVDHQKVIDDFSKVSWSNQKLVVRSSAISEDTALESNAGKYESILNVEKANIKSAIQSVIKSYGDQFSPQDQVLIQPQLENVSISGVVFTIDPNSGGHYYILNYDDTGDTSAVTSGAGKDLKTKILHKSSQASEEDWVVRLCALCDELEALFCRENLDIEFAVTQTGDIYLFQVRPLVIKSASKIDQSEQNNILQQIETKIKTHSSHHPYLYGKQTVFGIMPDWNPAEIIGVKPKNLALTLYKELVTDNIWAYQRDNYGYKNLRSFPLLIDFFGLPYIDVRVSFNSFLPKQINEELAEKLINFYIQKLIDKPYLHDKVEFEIVYSCYTFDLKENLKELKAANFTDAECTELEDLLRSLTNTVINKDTGLWKLDLDKIETLKQRQDILINSDVDLISRIYWLLEDCKRYGTLPFAGLARAGFIAIQILNSMVKEGVLTVEQKFSFLNNLDTISSTIKKDLSLLDKTTFLSKYGHLRPGTYDISSPRYDEDSDLYFEWDNIKGFHLEEIPEFQLGFNQMKAIDKLLKDHKIDHDVIGLFSFLKIAIEGREYAKFVFTKSLSDALSLIKKLGAQYGFSGEDMAFADINTIRGLYNSSKNIGKEISKSIEKGKQYYEITKSLNLPPLIVKPENVWQFDYPETKPNFITQKNITAPVGDIQKPHELTGKIVFIPNADPGYDWIFTHNIAGFITAYGGVNSHMAIRAGELGLPAIVGAGEILFSKWSKGKLLHLDCMNHLVEIIH